MAARSTPIVLTDSTPLIMATFITDPGLAAGGWRFDGREQTLTHVRTGKRYVVHKHAGAAEPDTFMATTRPDGSVGVRPVIKLRFKPDPRYRLAPDSGAEAAIMMETDDVERGPSSLDEEAQDEPDRELGDDDMHVDAQEAEEAERAEEWLALQQTLSEDDRAAARAEEMGALARDMYVLNRCKRRRVVVQCARIEPVAVRRRKVGRRATTGA